MSDQTRGVLQLTVVGNHKNLSRTVALEVLRIVSQGTGPDSDRRMNVVLSAGETPTDVYAILARDFREACDWSRIALWQMDEYVDGDIGIPLFANYLHERVVKPLALKDAHLVIVEHAGDATAVIEEHERQLISAGGIDLVLHGIGTNGHIGFNEPGSSPTSRARLVQLAHQTREDISAETPPVQGVTLGMECLLSAKRTVVMASGQRKATAMSRMLDGPISTESPASFLRHARETTVFLDADAARLLNCADPTAGADTSE